MLLFIKVLVLTPHNKMELLREKKGHLLEDARSLLLTSCP